MAERPLPFTLDEFKSESLVGVPLTFPDMFGNTVTYPDATILRRIKAAVNEIERRTQIDIWPRRVISRAHSLYPNLVQGVDYDIDEDPLDYLARDFFAQGYVKLRRWPIKQVDVIQFRFPEDTIIQDIPQEWMRIYHQTGQIHVVAVAGSTMPVIIGREGGFLPLLTASLQRSGVPQLVYVQYTSGLDWQNETFSRGWNAGAEFYEDVRLAIEYQAKIYILLDLSALKLGISSESISEDGQSQSVTYARGKGGVFAQEIEGLQEQTDRLIKSIRQFRKGIVFGIL